MISFESLERRMEARKEGKKESLAVLQGPRGSDLSSISSGGSLWKTMRRKKKKKRN